MEWVNCNVLILAQDSTAKGAENAEEFRKACLILCVLYSSALQRCSNNFCLMERGDFPIRIANFSENLVCVFAESGSAAPDFSGSD